PPEEKKQQQPVAQKPVQYLPQDMATGKAPVNLKELAKPAKGVPVGEVPAEEAEDDDKKGKRPGSVVGRDKRHQQRAARSAQRKGRESELLTARNLLSGEEGERPHRVRLDRLKKKRQQPTMPRKGKVPVAVPITVRALSEALGVRSMD